MHPVTLMHPFHAAVQQNILLRDLAWLSVLTAAGRIESSKRLQHPGASQGPGLSSGEEGRSPEAGGGVFAGEGLLIVQQQALVADIVLGLGHDGVVLVQAAGSHELDGLVHAPGQVHVRAPLIALVHEVQVPLRDALQPSIATCTSAESVTMG